MAAGKLQEIVPTRPITYREPERHQPGAAGDRDRRRRLPRSSTRTSRGAFPLIIVLSLAFGVLLIMPIGGADMPTVISLLNSYAGLSAVAMGFVLENKLLITAGRARRIVGLDPVDHHVPGDEPVVHQRAVRRVRPGAGRTAAGEAKTAKSATPRTPPSSSTNADRVVIVPGYGMAVAQAQHRVRELYDLLTKRGVDVKFAIHPVAGRMPGHMNVLLAEAEIPYDALVEMDDINPDLPQTDVALVIGANDVVNPAARHDKTSPIFGMPIIDADKAKTVIAIKRSMNPGFAGIDNELYYADNTLMVFGDAKQVLGDIVKAVSGEGGGH